MLILLVACLVVPSLPTGLAHHDLPSNTLPTGRCPDTGSATTPPPGPTYTFLSNAAVLASPMKKYGTGAAEDPVVLHVDGCFTGSFRIENTNLHIRFERISFWGGARVAFTIQNTAGEIVLEDVYLSHGVQLLSAVNASSVVLRQSPGAEAIVAGRMGTVSNSKLDFVNVVWAGIEGGLRSISSEVTVVASLLEAAGKPCAPNFGQSASPDDPPTENAPPWYVPSEGAGGYVPLPVSDMPSLPWAELRNAVVGLPLPTAVQPAQNHIRHLVESMGQVYSDLPRTSLRDRLQATTIYGNPGTPHLTLLNATGGTVNLVASTLGGAKIDVAAVQSNVNSYGSTFYCSMWGFVEDGAKHQSLLNRFERVAIPFNIKNALDTVYPRTPPPQQPTSPTSLLGPTSASTSSFTPTGTFLEVCAVLHAASPPVMISDTALSFVAANFQDGPPLHASDITFVPGASLDTPVVLDDKVNLFASTGGDSSTAPCTLGTSSTLGILVPPPILHWYLLDGAGAVRTRCLPVLGCSPVKGTLNVPMVDPNLNAIHFLAGAPDALSVTGIAGFYNVVLGQPCGYGFSYATTKYWFSEGSCGLSSPPPGLLGPVASLSIAAPTLGAVFGPSIGTGLITDCMLAQFNTGGSINGYLDRGVAGCGVTDALLSVNTTHNLELGTTFKMQATTGSTPARTAIDIIPATRFTGSPIVGDYHADIIKVGLSGPVGHLRVSAGKPSTPIVVSASNAGTGTYTIEHGGKLETGLTATYTPGPYSSGPTLSASAPTIGVFSLTLPDSSGPHVISAKNLAGEKHLSVQSVTGRLAASVNGVNAGAYNLKYEHGDTLLDIDLETDASSGTTFVVENDDATGTAILETDSGYASRVTALAPGVQLTATYVDRLKATGLGTQTPTFLMQALDSPTRPPARLSIVQPDVSVGGDGLNVFEFEDMNVKRLNLDFNGSLTAQIFQPDYDLGVKLVLSKTTYNETEPLVFFPGPDMGEVSVDYATCVGTMYAVNLFAPLGAGIIFPLTREPDAGDASMYRDWTAAPVSVTVEPSAHAGPMPGPAECKGWVHIPDEKGDPNGGYDKEVPFPAP